MEHLLKSTSYLPYPEPRSERTGLKRLAETLHIINITRAQNDMVHIRGTVAISAKCLSAIDTSACVSCFALRNCEKEAPRSPCSTGMVRPSISGSAHAPRGAVKGSSNLMPPSNSGRVTGGCRTVIVAIDGRSRLPGRV